MKINPFNPFMLLSLFVSILYFSGIIVFLTDYEINKCLMTYMFEYPQFVKISRSNMNKPHKYGLYAYSEGKFTSKVRDMKFSGIPVIFLPGNAGSFKQVRSLSSVALRMALDSKVSYHFDYFTVDFNEEWSGIYGPLLNDQLYYVNNSIYTVFDLYKESRNPPKTLVLIGHSMGGVVAKKMLSLLPDESTLVSVLLTLAAPLNKPPVYLDKSIYNFYKSPNTNVNRLTTIINLSGGFSDFLISPDLTNIKGEPNDTSLNLVTTNIPRSWVEANHVQILWCKQTILAINRALFDIVDIKTKQISLDPDYRMAVFKHHLVHNSGINIRNIHQYKDIVKIDYKGEWIEDIRRQYSVNLTGGIKQPRWYMVSFTFQPTYEVLTVLAVNLEVTDWAFACNAAYPKGPSKVCIEGQHLSHLSEIAPSANQKRRLLTVNMHDIKRANPELTHVVFRALPTSETVAFHVDIYGKDERKMEVKLPNWWKFGKTKILETNNRAIQYDLEIPELSHVLQFYELFVEPIECSTESYHATASLHAPWAHHDIHRHFTEIETHPLKIRLFGKKLNSSATAKIRLILDPSCSFRISMKFSKSGALGQLARHYSLMLLTNIAVVVLLTFAAQLEDIKNSGKCSLFFIAMKSGATPYFVLIAVKLLSKIFSFPIFVNVFPQPHSLFVTNDLGLDFILVPVLLYLISVGIVWIFAILYAVSLITLESTVHKLCLKMLAKTVSFSISWSDYLMQFLHKVPLFVVGTLIFLCFSTCGGLALCVGLIFYFLKLTQMSQDFIEEVVWFFVKTILKQIKEKLKRKNTHKTESNNKKEQKSITNAEQANTTNNVNEQTKSDNEQKSVKNTEQANTTNNVNEQSKSDNEQNSITNTEQANIANNVNEKTKSDNEQKSITNDTEQAITTKSEIVHYTQNSEQNNTSGINRSDNEEKFSAHNEIIFHSTLFFIWFLVTVLNIPAVLTWAHNFNYTKKLTPDESFFPGIIMCICAFPIWHLELPKTNRKYMDKLQLFIQSVSIISLMYAIDSLFILNYLLTATFALVVLHQVFAPKSSTFTSDEVDNDGNGTGKKSEQQEIHEKYDSIKKKVD